MLKKVFGLDLRSLAAFRVGVALFVLYDLIARSFDLTAHYTDAGTMPRVFASHYYATNSIYAALSPTAFSPHMLTGAAFGIAIIFLIHAVAAIGLLIGYRTRLMTFLVWFLLASLDTRNPLVLSVGDDVVRVLLFFAIFLPLGARYSIDAALNTHKGPALPDLYASPSTAVYYLQVISLYFFSALMKSGAEWRSEGTALYYAFNYDQFALPLAHRLLAFPGLLKVLTFVAWWVEVLGGWVLLIPHPLGKLGGLLLLGGLQVGIWSTLALGHNPAVNLIVLLPFIPAWFWDRQRARKRIEIVYDGDCGFCRKMVLILVELHRPGLIQPPRPAQGKDLVTLRRENSWIVRDEAGTEFYRFDAVIEFLAASPVDFWKVPFLRLKPLHAVGTACYRYVASHRGFFAKVYAPFRPRPIAFKTYRWCEALAVFLLVAVLIYNTAWLVPMQSARSIVDFPIVSARLEQYWGMFAPSPSKQDGWFVVEGQLRNGQKVEGFREQREIRYDKPSVPSGFYPNERWRRYMINIASRPYREFRDPFTLYVCGKWNEKNSGADHMDKVSVYFMSEITPPPGQSSVPAKVDLIDFPCPR